MFGESMIRLDNVTYRYRNEDRPVLKDLNLAVKAGETVSVMGANGSGKSTLAKVLAGLIEVDRGRIRVETDEDAPLPVGILFQNPDNQMVSVTVEKEIAFALENLGVSQEKMEAMITDTLERFSIGHLRERLNSELSGGEKQRVALAAVMVCSPPILVLDEPDSFLDESGKAILMRQLLNLRRTNPAMIQIHITQYPGIARNYSRLIVLDQGEVVADASPREIFNQKDFCLRTGLLFSGEADRQVLVPAKTNGYSPIQTDGPHTLVLDKACFSYNENHPVLKNISFQMRRSEIMGVVGPTGSGKSSLGLLLCGLLKPSSGMIKYLDGRKREIAPDRLVGHVSAVFQQPERQFFLPTCAEEISFGPRNVGHPLSDGDIDSQLAMVGLDPGTFTSKDPFTLSGGEKRRLAFAAVLSMRPQFVVFDEPTCGLDQEGVGRFITLVQLLKDQGMGITIISHDGGVIKGLADRILHLRSDLSWTERTNKEFFTSQHWVGVVSQPDEDIESTPEIFDK